MEMFNAHQGHRAKPSDQNAGARHRRHRNASGFTLTEVMVSLVLSVLAFHGILKAYAFTTARSEWSAHSLAAQSLALQHVEAMRCAKWDPRAWPAVDEAGVTNFTSIEVLDVPSSGAPTLATNQVSVTTVSANPPLRQIRVDCIWAFPPRGTFTNTIITLRASDQ